MILSGSSNATVLAGKLPGPNAMAIDATNSTLYITTKGDGNILQFDLPR